MNEGDKVEYFDNASKALGIVFFKFDTKETMHNILDGKAEALEFRIKENAPVAGIPIEQLKIKDNILIACIINNGKIKIPRGRDIIEAGDTVIIVEMFDDRETFWKKLDEPTDDNIKKLADECTDIPVNLTDELMGTDIGEIV